MEQRQTEEIKQVEIETIEGSSKSDSVEIKTDENTSSPCYKEAVVENDSKSLERIAIKEEVTEISPKGETDFKINEELLNNEKHLHNPKDDESKKKMLTEVGNPEELVSNESINHETVADIINERESNVNNKNKLEESRTLENEIKVEKEVEHLLINSDFELGTLEVYENKESMSKELDSNQTAVKVEVISAEDKMTNISAETKDEEKIEVIESNASLLATATEEQVSNDITSLKEIKTSDDANRDYNCEKEVLFRAELNESKESASTTSDDAKIVKKRNSIGDDSEYETLEEDNLEEERPEEYGSESEEGEEEEEEDDAATSDNRECSGSSSPEMIINEERQAADGQESEKKERKLDHDEDRRDPQYIPKKGMFYEHDDRTADGEEQKKESPRETKKGKVWDSKEHWSHDLYVESEQLMKSTDELIAVYGYDIRKDDGPPKARRRRRYVKGPNKYERSWEDEQAYIKSPGRGGFRGMRRGGRAGAGRNLGRNGDSSGGSHTPKEFIYKASDFPAHLPKKSSQLPQPYASPPREESWDPPAAEKSSRGHQQTQQHQHQSQQFTPPNHNKLSPVNHRPAYQKSHYQGTTIDKINNNPSVKSSFQQNNHQSSNRGSRGSGNDDRNDLGSSSGNRQGEHPLFQMPQGQPSQRGRGRGRLSGPRPPGARVNIHNEHNTERGRNSHDHNSSSHPHLTSPKSTADEDIAMLAQHFSEAVINIDNKNIIRTSTNSIPATSQPQQQSTPMTISQAIKQAQQANMQQQQHREAREQHQQSTSAGSSHAAGERYKLDEPTTVVDKAEHQKSKRYSTQRQRALPIQHGGPNAGPNPQPPQPQTVVPTNMPPPPTHVPPPPPYMHQQPPPPPTAYYHTGCVDSDVVAPGPVQPVEVVTFLQPPPTLHYVQPQFIQTPTGPIAMPTPPPPAGPEMYQGGGITYYNTLSQMSQNRPNCAASRRLKVAIPIVAPPQDQQQQAGVGPTGTHSA